MIRQLLRWFRCSHPYAYLERRAVDRVPGVLHSVCPDCGHAAPLLDRTPREHAAMRRRGRVKALRAHRVP